MSEVGYSIVTSSMAGNERFLYEMLSSIAENTEGSYEVIVVINGDNPKGKSTAEMFDFVRIVESSEKLHFSQAYNLGLSEARGKFLVAMNDDVLVTPDWNVRLMNCLTRFEKKLGEERGCPAPAIVGPSSNYVGGAQMIPPEIGNRVTPQNYEDVARQIAENNVELWVPVPFISGFCMMINQTFYRQHAPEFFDERIANGAEDNLVCLKALFEGWSLVICGDCFIYHYGSKTITRTDPDGGLGVKNLLDYYKIANTEIVPKESYIASCCRTQLLDAHDLGVWMEAVEQHCQWADLICIVNDRSEEKIWARAEDVLQHLADEYENVTFEVKTFSRGHDEFRDRTTLLEMVRAHIKSTDTPEQAWWFFSFDADEIFEDKVTKEYLDRLTHPPKPDILGYQVHWYTFWDQAAEMWRADSTFGRMCGARFVRMLPGYSIMKTESGLHLGNVPGVGMLNQSRISSMRVKHYGYQSQEERQRKYQFYENIDETKEKQEIGGEDYKHLIAPQVTLMPWQEDCGVTIGTTVLNEEIRLHNYLDTLWAFADQMIFCDTGSEDRTIALLEYFGAKVLDFEREAGLEWDPTFATEGGDMSRARNTIFPYVKTEWFWQFDVDEQLIPGTGNAIGNPLSIIRRIIENQKVDGYQFMFHNHQPTGKFTFSQATRLMRNPKTWYYTGYTHETMDEAGQDKFVAHSPIQASHQGWLIDDEQTKKKFKRYFRGNLRMIRDFPEDCRGWFNAGLHLLDAGGIHPGFEVAGLEFIHQALARRSNFPTARKELLTHDALKLFNACRSLAEMTPEGHPYHEFALGLANNVEPYMSDLHELVRVPEHAVEVLQEPAFSDFRDMVERLGQGLTDHEQLANYGTSDAGSGPQDSGEDFRGIIGDDRPEHLSAEGLIPGGIEGGGIPVE